MRVERIIQIDQFANAYERNLATKYLDALLEEVEERYMKLLDEEAPDFPNGSFVVVRPDA